MHLNFHNFEKVIIGVLLGVYMSNLGCPSTSKWVDQEFKTMHISLNVMDWEFDLSIGLNMM